MQSTNIINQCAISLEQTKPLCSVEPVTLFCRSMPGLTKRVEALKLAKQRV